tara:strand:- start:2550 stop:3389 length:840 start_codon:yes stop_codon:yes gene_type:complete
MIPTFWIDHGDALEHLKKKRDGLARCCVTSPPYYRLRNYGTSTQLGQEPSVDEYVNKLVVIFRELKRVLLDDGTLWLNLGDSYADKNLLGVPWRTALALQDDGWILRSDVIWHKTNPIPAGGGVHDRFTPAHEYVFLLAKNPHYFFNMEAALEPLEHPDATTPAGFGGYKQSGNETYSGKKYDASDLKGRRPRDVWSLPVARYNGEHNAVMPDALAEKCILAGTEVGDTVLDPFAGAGTTGLMANKLGRHFHGIELNELYVQEARRRIEGDSPLFARRN